jgi:hypothetical protein
MENDNNPINQELIYLALPPLNLPPSNINLNIQVPSLAADPNPANMDESVELPSLLPHALLPVTLVTPSVISSLATVVAPIATPPLVNLGAYPLLDTVNRLNFAYQPVNRLPLLPVIEQPCPDGRSNMGWIMK